MPLRAWFVLALLVMTLGPTGRVHAESFPSLDAPNDASFDSGPPMDTPSPDAPDEGMDAMIEEDVGASGMDAGHDSGPIVPVPPSDGCSCRASGATASTGWEIAGLTLGLALAVRRRRASRGT